MVIIYSISNFCYVIFVLLEDQGLPEEVFLNNENIYIGLRVCERYKSLYIYYLPPYLRQRCDSGELRYLSAI